MVPPKRYAAGLLLLVLGLLMVMLVGTATDLQTTYVAEQVDPAADASQIADVDHDVVHLDQWMGELPPAASEALRTAITEGSFDGSVPPELYIRLDDHSTRTRVAVYEGRYYRMNATLSDETTETKIEFTPLNSTTAARMVSSSYDAVGPIVRSAVNQGSVSTREFPDETGLVEKGGIYYLVTPRHEGAIVGKFLATIGSFVLNPVGYAYTVAGIVLLVALRVRRKPRPIDEVSSLGVAGVTILLLWISTAFAGSGSLALRFGMFPLIGGVAGLGLLAGVYLYRHSWARLVLLTFAAPVISIGAVTAVIGVPGLLFGVLATVVGWVGSFPLAGYGYAFGRNERNRREGVSESPMDDSVES